MAALFLQPSLIALAQNSFAQFFQSLDFYHFYCTKIHQG
jgi:hypothetical protein